MPPSPARQNNSRTENTIMEYRNLGASGLRVPVLSFGAGTFGGSGPLFSHWGTTDVEEARRLVDICLEAGVNLFDTADVYSAGASEEVLGQAIKGRRNDVLISTKRSEEHTSELQSLMRISYAVFCLKKKKK